MYRSSELVPQQVFKCLDDLTASLLLEASDSESPSYIVPAAQIANKLGKLSPASVRQKVSVAMEALQRRPEVPSLGRCSGKRLAVVPCIIIVVNLRVTRLRLPWNRLHMSLTAFRCSRRLNNCLLRSYRSAAPFEFQAYAFQPCMHRRSLCRPSMR